MQALDIYQVCNLTNGTFILYNFSVLYLLTWISLSAKIQILCVVYFMKSLISGLHLVGNLTNFKVLITCKKQIIVLVVIIVCFYAGRSDCKNLGLLCGRLNLLVFK